MHISLESLVKLSEDTYYFAGFGEPDIYNGQIQNFPLKATFPSGSGWKKVELLNREDIIDCLSTA